MNICITSSSIFNAYASTLIYKLIQHSDKPICIINAEKSKFIKLKNRLRKTGLKSTIKKIFQHYKIARCANQNSRNYLKEYALVNNIEDWNICLSKISKKEGIEYIKVDNINSKEAVDYIKNKEVDILINAGGGIFKKSFISAPRIGILNAHMGFLPTFRGMNVLEWSLFHGHKIGVTLHFIDRGIDTGDILLFREIPIERGDTINNLRAKSLVINIELILQGINLIKNKKETRIKQQLERGKQYFVMHKRLKTFIGRSLQNIDFK